MDNLTHTLLALTAANAGLRRFGAGATATLVIASNVPDIEFLTRLTEKGRLAYLAAHRGPTHGPLGLALGAAVAAAVWLVIRRRRTENAPASFPALVALGLGAVAGHVLLDLSTSYGTRVLSPFSPVWYGVDWMPIVDAWLWLLLAAGLAAARLAPRRRRAIAAAVLAAAVLDAGFRAAAHEIALDRAVAIESAAGIPRGARPSFVFSYLDSGRPAALPAALPWGSSPFAWRLITRTPSGFEVRDVNLLDRGTPARAVRFPADHSPIVALAAAAPTARVFLAFSRFPSVEVMQHSNGDATVHWYDMRFGRAADGADGRRHTSPFGAWVRLAPDGTLLRDGLGPG